MKKLAFLVGVLLMSGCVLADIFISEPEAVYNLGDRLYVDLGGLRGVENGNLDIDLKCGNSSLNMVRIPARAFASDEDQSYSIPYKVLDWEDLGILNLDSIIGTCQIVTSIGGSVSSSKSFEISDKASVSVSLDKDNYNPGEVVDVKINVVKKNGVVMNGFVEGVNTSSFSEEIIDGVSGTNFIIGGTAEAGVYYVKVRAYDIGSSGVMNEGTGVASYIVNQIATSLVLSLSDAEVLPGENFSVGLEVFDQSGVNMDGSIFVKVISPEGKEIESVVKSGEFVLMDFFSNSSVGTWEIISTFDNLVQTREFEMMPLQKVDFDFEDAVLIVKNIGNVLYNKTIDVNIGEDVMTLDLKIDVGGVRKFNLKAPVGTYDVIVGDGEHEVTRTVLLTGNAVSVSDFKSGAIFKNYSIVWIFLIVVLAGIGSVMFIRYRKTRTLGEEGSLFGKFVNRIKRLGRTEKVVKAGVALKKQAREKVPNKIKSHIDESLNFTRKSPAVQGLDANNYSHEDKTMVDLTKNKAISAESTLVLKGDKHNSAVVAMNIKNYEEDLGGIAKQSLVEIVEKAKGKGLIDYRNEYIFVVFNPLVTRTYRNEALAVKCGMSILENLNAYNKKFRDKIEFGIGVHSGDMIVSKEDGRLKYNGIGNTISFAKRMGDVDSAKVVVSEPVRKKLLRDLKVVKGKEIGENMTYIVNGVVDRSGDAARLKQLLKRSKG